MEKLDKRVARGNATRDRIVETATSLFAQEGYAAVSIESICSACKISRGALFHHFASKEALFIAALEDAEAIIAARMRAAATNARSPMDALKAGADVWLVLAASDPVVRRLVLVDAPSVLGWKMWREIDGRQGFGLIRQALVLASKAGQLGIDQVEPAAHGLLALLIEMALLIAAAPADRSLARSARSYFDTVLKATLSARSTPASASSARHRRRSAA